MQERNIATGLMHSPNIIIFLYSWTLRKHFTSILTWWNVSMKPAQQIIVGVTPFFSQ